MLVLGLFLSVFVAIVAASSDPEAHMTTAEIINHWGYPAETFHVSTEDGYVIELHHIPYGRKQGPSGNKTRPVVFLQHGFDGASANWVVNLPEQSAGFMFADAGYDVWLGNVRGNTYGKSHKELSTWRSRFWEYSFDEHAKYDLPAMIDFVLNRTRQEQLYFVGHSQGTLTMFAKLSDDQKFGQKVGA
uniref:Abhydro_lipase domain-containing protein n=1 Tax=Steinernema glaseri TaxID=37863 RepID=A0A1I7Y913_9BILA